jgi:type II secretory pathway pseudopilin PulG
MRLRQLLRSQTGDTIVEVLIAVAVLTLVLTASFAVSNKGSQQNRQAQERNEGSKLVESQIESLRSALSSENFISLPTGTSKFCLNSSGNIVTFGAYTPTIDPQADNLDSYPAECKDPSGLYVNFVERDSANPNIFIAHTRWYRVGGGGVEEATRHYRIYPDMASRAQSGGTAAVGCPVDFYFNERGGCTPCDIGFSSPGGLSKACAPIPARVSVEVHKVPPRAGNTTPECTDAASASAGIAVKLDGNGGPYTGSSTAAWDVNFASNYTASITAMPDKFELCPAQSTASVNSTALGTPRSGNQRTAVLKIRPLCFKETRYGPEYEHFEDHAHSDREDVYRTVYYYEHKNPYGGAPWDGRRTGWPASDVYQVESHGGNNYQMKYVYRSDLGENSLGKFYEQWVQRAGQEFVETRYNNYNHPHSLGTYGDPYEVNVCPS